MKEKCEESNFDLISHFNINPHCRVNVRGLHLNNCSDRQLTNDFLNYIEKRIIYYKFETMKNIVEDTFDIFQISQTKIDNSFPNGQFSMNG